MGPSKRKGSVRRQVLDLNTKEDSPSRPTWQTKYQHVLPSDAVHKNGDSTVELPSPAQKNNPLSGLLSNYNSDSDNEEGVKKPSKALDAKVEDFLKEIHSISAEMSNQTPAESTAVVAAAGASSKDETQGDAYYPASVTAWQQCYDHNSGYPYYWNTETNEVTWEMPPDLKAALTSIALKQQQQQQQNQQQQQVNAGNKGEPVQQKSVPETKKKVCKYPWQTESDSEDEKIEMITSFGPQSGDESDEPEKKELKKKEKSKKFANVLGPQLPARPCLTPKPGPSLDPAKVKSDCTVAPEDPEGLNETTYETSSLLAHCVQDTGPPGDENFQKTSAHTSTNKVPAGAVAKSHSSIVQTGGGPLNNTLQTLNSSNNKTSVESSASTAKVTSLESKESQDRPFVVDEGLGHVAKKEDSSGGIPAGSSKEPGAGDSTKLCGMALVANYSDDSEPEDNGGVEKPKSSPSSAATATKSIFPIEIPQQTGEKVKPLFPCMDADVPKIAVENWTKEGPFQSEVEPATKTYTCEMDVDDPGAFKAFKRKKRLEFATRPPCEPSTSKTDAKSIGPELPVGTPTTHYNMDPNMNERRGFGFSAVRSQTETEKKTYKNYGGIQFVKAETINLGGTREKGEGESDSAGAHGKESTKEPVHDEEIEDAAKLLREKAAFLVGGSSEISPIQHMAIELETLVLAWQQGALTPPYLLRWLNEKCADLIRHEKAAAPSGWTCLWDRKNKRYYYRNSTTKAVQWEYPMVEQKAKAKEEVEGGGDEMDICDTPPHLSPAGPDKQTNEQPSTPPPPTISGAAEEATSFSPTPQPPPPPQITFSAETVPPTSKVQKKKKRKASEIGHGTEGDGESSSGSYEQISKNADAAAPPLPPMPPPPPPPPDESPPPLPDSPPPLPLDPDQPLPPGVDEPEYSVYRRVSPKHSYKKTQLDSAAYQTELMMTYGYGLPVQQVVSTNGQAIAMQMQPLEYHTYMQEPVTTPYLVQSAPSHVIQCSAKKPKVSLNSELMSFYSDLAQLDVASTTTESSSAETRDPSAVSGTTAPSASHEPDANVPSTTTATSITTAATLQTSTTAPSTVTTTKTTDSLTSNGVTVKKKKKVKATTGLSLKKKGVSSLVAKWQQVQQEVRRDFTDDDEDDVPLNK